MDGLGGVDGIPGRIIERDLKELNKLNGIKRTDYYYVYPRNTGHGRGAGHEREGRDEGGVRLQGTCWTPRYSPN